MTPLGNAALVYHPSAHYKPIVVTWLGKNRLLRSRCENGVPADSLRDEDPAVQYRHFDISRLCDHYRGRDALTEALSALDPETCTVCRTVVGVGIGIFVAKKRDLPGLERFAGGYGVPQ
jgi:hypothetical protein